MSRKPGSIVRGFQSRAGYPHLSGPAASAGYLLRMARNVKVAPRDWNQNGSAFLGIGASRIKGLAGRNGRARTCDPRFWSSIALYQVICWKPKRPTTFDPRRGARPAPRPGEQQNCGHECLGVIWCPSFISRQKAAAILGCGLHSQNGPGKRVKRNMRQPRCT